MLRRVICALGVLGLPACTPTQKSDTKIIGGQAASENYNFFVGLYEVGNQGSSLCGGTLVAPDVVVTAAHCVFDVYDDLEVGIALVDNKNPSREQMRKVKAIQIHPEYVPVGNDADIALLFLESQPDDATQLKALTMNKVEAWPAPGMNTRVIGHGNISSYGWLEPPILQEVDVPVVDLETCKTVYPEVTSSQICAGLMVEGGKDSCQGDSGGPLFTTGPDPKLIGIVSFGDGCAQKAAPGVYTRIASFASWVETQIEIYHHPPVATVQDLADLVKNYCYVPGSNSFEFNSGEDFVKLESRILADASAPLNLPKGESWQTIQARDQLTEIRRCAFTLANGHAVEVIQAKDSAAVPAYRGFARIDGNWYEVKNKESQTLTYSCQAGDPKTKPLDASAENSEYGLWLWYMKIGNDYYETQAYDGDPAEATELDSCNVQGYNLSLYQSEQDLLAKVQVGSSAAVWFQLRKSEGGTSEITATVKPLSLNLGVLEINNDGWSDVFTWNLSCDFKFSLKDRVGNIREAQNIMGRWEILFAYPDATNGAIATSYSRTFTVKLEDTLINDMPMKACDINGTSLPITLDNGF